MHANWRTNARGGYAELAHTPFSRCTGWRRHRILAAESAPYWPGARWWSSPGGEELPVGSGAEHRGRLPQCPRPPRLRGAVHRLPLPRRVLRHAAPRQARRLLLHQLPSVVMPLSRTAGRPAAEPPRCLDPRQMIWSELAGKPSGTGKKYLLVESYYLLYVCIFSELLLWIRRFFVNSWCPFFLISHSFPNIVVWSTRFFIRWNDFSTILNHQL